MSTPQPQTYIVKLDNDREKTNQLDLIEMAEDIAYEKSPSMDVTIYTKYYPPTRLDPPEWDEEETTVEYEDMPESARKDLTDQIIDTCMDDLVCDGIYDSKEAWLLSIKQKIDDNLWSKILRSWESASYDKVQEFAQNQFDERCTYEE